MVQVNDTVLYGSQSVCTVTEICEKTVGKEKLRYYALKPVYDGNPPFMCRAQRKAGRKMRRILSAAEIRALIDSLAGESLGWIENDALRRERYGEILAGSDRRQLALLIRTLYLHRESLKSTGRKFHAADEQLLERRAKAAARGIRLCAAYSPEEVPLFITRRLEAAENNAAGRAGIAKRAEMWYV